MERDLKATQAELSQAIDAVRKQNRDLRFEKSKQMDQKPTLNEGRQDGTERL
jgi:hypothetical protein